MPKIYTTESIIERFKLKNSHDFDYSKVDYKGMSIPVTVICPIHNDIMLTPSQLLRNVGCPKCTNDKLTQLKTNKENFIKESNEVHQNKYDYSKVDYKGVTTKVKIICPDHGEFWQTPRVHLKGCGCPKCGLERQNDATRLTTEEFIIRANKIQGNKYDYSKVEYVDYMTKVCIICPEHGEFWQTPNKHLLGQGCPKCGNTKKLTLTEFIERSRKIHGDKYDYSKVRYINNGTKVCIICPDHGEFWQTPHNHLIGHGCPKCKNNKISASETKTTEKFVLEARKVHGDKYDYSRTKYLSAKDKVCIICPEHGEFWQEASSHLSGCGCPKCNHIISKAEIEIAEYVRSLYDGEVITNCRNMLTEHKELDIYIPSLKVAFEYDGMIWHSDRYRVDANYHLKKTEECANKGIKLYHIFEYEWINRQEIVKGKIKHIMGVNYNEYNHNGDYKIIKINEEEAKEFNERYNLQGHIISSLYIGMYCNNELKSMLSLQKENDNKWRVVRFTNNVNNSLIVNSIINYFIDKYKPNKIEAYEDRRWVANSNDSIYRRTGFELVDIIPPDYGYTKGQNDYINKEKLKDCHLSNDYYRIYDCGQYKYEWKNVN